MQRFSPCAQKEYPLGATLGHIENFPTGADQLRTRRSECSRYDVRAEPIDHLRSPCAPGDALARAYRRTIFTPLATLAGATHSAVLNVVALARAGPS